MKYRYINPEVFVQKVTSDVLSKLESKPIGGEIPILGDFLVTFPDGTAELYTEKELTAKFKPSLPMPDNKREMYSLCTSIIDQEALVDEDNAEELLVHAVEIARKLRRLIQ
jgi:hypothetical protein